MEERLKNKKLYKILLILLKYIPIIIGISYLLSTICSWLGFNLTIFSIISGLSIFTWLFLIISSFVFKYCLYHRMFLYYAFIIDILNWFIKYNLMKAIEFTNKFKDFIKNKIDIMSKTNPILNFSQPFLIKIIDNKTNKIVDFMNMLSDDKGEIDVKSLLSDMIQRLNTVDPFILDIFTKIEIGGGKIKINVPLTNKQIQFTTEDVESFKNTLFPPLI